MGVGDPYPQYTGPDSEAKWWVQLHRLTVNSGEDRAVCVTSNSGADHSPFVGASGRPSRLRLDATATPSRPSRPWAGSRADGPPEPVPVVGNQDDRPRGCSGLRPGPAQVEAPALRAECFRQRSRIVRSFASR